MLVMICIITIFIAIGNQTTASCSYASQQFLARTRALGVIPATTMAWSDSSQKNRWHTRSLQEWEEWIDGLAEKKGLAATTSRAGKSGRTACYDNMGHLICGSNLRKGHLRKDKSHLRKCHLSWRTCRTSRKLQNILGGGCIVSA